MALAQSARDAVFEEHRSLLFGVAYRMLGTVTEAEDAVQDAYLRFRAAEGPIHNFRAFLVTVVTRLCLDNLKSAHATREQYIGPWLPEPIVSRAGTEPSPEDTVDSEESVSYAFLVMLEELGPVERAVFLLREVFDYDYADISQVVNKSETACRQVFHRARQRVAERQHRHSVNYSQRVALTARFMQAAGEGDMAGLLELLSADVVAYSDGGGKRRAALRPIFGPDRVARFIVAAAKKDPPVAFGLADVNGAPGVLLWGSEGDVHTLLLLEADDDGRIGTLYAVRNPDKLAHIPLAVS